MQIFNMADVMKLEFFLAKSKFRSLEVGWKKIFAGFLIFHTAINIVYATGCSNDSECFQGSCVDSVCVCDPGWIGDDCSHCGGRVKLDSPAGNIIDSVETYREAHTCTWLIESEEPDSLIRLKFEHFETECCWDYLLIYDGDGMFSPMVAAYSGIVVPYEGETNVSNPEVTTTSGYAYLHFYSDAAYTMIGFNISYSVNTCPNNCSGNGDCQLNAECDCDPEWTGKACDIPVCSNSCGDNGHCEMLTLLCECVNGYKGYECEVPPTNGSWSVLPDQIRLGVASLAALVENDTILFVGGYPFSNQEQDYDFLMGYDINSKSSWAIIPVSVSKPEARYGHSVVLDRDRIIMYGGTVTEYSPSRIVSELWFFNITTESWEESKDNAGVRVAVDGHTAHLVDEKMIVLFGYSPMYGYSNIVQEFDTVTGQWSIVNTTGVNVNGAYAHSSVYDQDNRMIYVYGGYKAISRQSYFLSDELYTYTPDKKHWSILSPSGAHYVYLHSAVLIGGMMYVFGGNPHNETNGAAKCYSPELIVYDIRCDVWSRLPLENEIYTDLSRYGHSAVTHSGKMYVLSGYNGVMLQDIPIYTPGDCTKFIDEPSCIESSPGISCYWDSSESSCHTYTNVGPGVLHSMKECPLPSDNEQCNKNTDCNSCMLTFGCSWCGGDQDECSANCDADVNHDVCTGADFPCAKYYTCDSCKLQPDCHWNGAACRQRRDTDSDIICGPSCANMTDCSSCTNENCLWCSSAKRCVDSNSYVSSFPYGQCVSWHNRDSSCPGDDCSHFRTCDECHTDPSCGWCDDGSNTGLGTCMEGSYSQALGDICPAKQWYFIDCPACQCNGHSNCTNETICENCEDNTQGDQCQECSPGFYGDPTNGGNCSECFCNGHAEYCDNVSGQCTCTTKGIIGKECDRCDEDRKYYGDPTGNGTCYYDLLLNYQFTFNLTRADDKSITSINFKCIIDNSNRDIVFQLNADKNVVVMITFTSRSNPVETVLVDETPASRYRVVFSRKDFNFNSYENTTFYVYLSNFTVPFWFQISFSWRAIMMLDLLQFFVTFFSCFLSLLLIAAIIWKIKQKYDAYMRRRAHVVEMAQLASRPFATSCLEIEKEEAPADNSPAKPKRLASAISIEPCKGGKAAVLSLVIRLPSEEGGYAPVGYSGLTFGTAIVQVNAKKNTEGKDKGSIRQRKNQNQRAIPNGSNNCV
ncbi:attractin-like protein 1 isoform X2 [Ptychodera flava]|uniref:attractin-like protein 1 isoform X2 n=1 Tax=Ptychodera flava TaxID=63121 RepID=UPI00396A5493